MKMGVHQRLLTWCFIFQLSLLLIIAIEASPKFDESNLTLNERVSKIEAKDRHQDGEMVLLKNALDEERKLVHDLINRVEVLEGANKISGRIKRPVRLLPPHILRGKEKNETDEDDGSQFRFYGPATGCNDLGRLGYTLNGFYLVQKKENKSTNSSSSNNRQIEIVECRFRQKQKSGNQTAAANFKERRLGIIRFPNDNNSNNIQPLQPSRSDGKENFDLNKTDDKESEIKFTTRTKKVKNSSTTQPRFDVKNYCLYKLRSEAHNFATPEKLLNMCFVAAERKIKKNGSIITTNEPKYYLAQSLCHYVNDEEHWTIRNKYICSNKNDMCLTVSPNIKDGGVFVNLMVREESAKSQQWIGKPYEQTHLVSLINVGTSLCLFEPLENKGTRKANTTVKTCPTGLPNLENLFYFEKVNSMNWKKCSPF